jgi:asparagine synthase (glutamine-hydrolysing)
VTENAPTTSGDETRLDQAFNAAIAGIAPLEGNLGVLFSGGVDSSLLAWELRATRGLRLFTIGLLETADLKAAEEGARQLGLPWEGSVVEPEEVRRLARELAAELGGLGRVDRSVQTAFALAVARAPSLRLVCGQGVDELFLGYAHYRGLPAPDALRRSEEDLRKLVEEEWPRSQRIAARLERTVVAPYLDERFVAAARAIPIERRRPDPVPKAFFRSWAERRGLPPSLAARPKRALQFGSGVDRVLRRMD